MNKHIRTMASRLKKRALLSAGEAKYALARAKIPDRFVYKNVPYFAQWESPELNGDFLSGAKSTNEDPKWKKSGAINKQEYHDWSFAGCGMACTKMILAYKLKKVFPLVKLGKTCATYGGYVMPLDQSPGLFHKAYIDFIREEYGLHAHSLPLSINGINRSLASGKLVIASVHPAIREPDSKPATKSGHLILVIGYDKKQRLLYIHNPSGVRKKSQAYAVITFSQFRHFYAHSAITVNVS